jgi:Flp pilus assembly protein TadG
MIRPRQAKAPARSAAAAVELAILATFVLIPMTYGMIELSRALQVKDYLTDAARSGCRIGIRPAAANSDIIGNANTVLTAQGLNPNDATITIQVNGQTVDAGTAQAGDQIAVKVALPAAKANWMLSWFISSGSVESETLTMMRQG